MALSPWIILANKNAKNGHKLASLRPFIVENAYLIVVSARAKHQDDVKHVIRCLFVD